MFFVGTEYLLRYFM